MKSLSLLLAVIVLSVSVACAQSTKMEYGVKYGHNALFGAFTAVSAEVEYETKRHFAIRGGAQYSSIGRMAAEIRPQYNHDINIGQLTGHAVLGYTYQSHMNNYIVGCGVSLDVSYLWVTLGYYHRTIAIGKEKICEPFNISYELGIRCLSEVQKWDLNIIITNSKLFEIERHYQPSFAAEGWWYPNDRWGVLLGASYKPAGVFNITSDYYQIYANIGVCYKW